MVPMIIYECQELFLMQAEQTKSIAQHLQRLESTMTQRIFTQQAIPSPAQTGYSAFPHQGSLPILIGPGQLGQAFAPVTHPAASSPGLSAPGQGYMTSPLPHHGLPFSTGPGQAAYMSGFASFFMPMQNGLSTTTTYSNQPPNKQLMRKQNGSYKAALMSGPRHVVFAGSVLWTEKIHRTKLNRTMVRSIFRLWLPKFGVILVAGCLISKIIQNCSKAS